MTLALCMCLGIGLAAEAPVQAASPTTAAERVAVSAQKKLSRKQRNQRIAKPLVKKRWHRTYKRQFTCLVKLWNRESSWNHTAHNPWSGAYGIPQALPGKKMRSAGKDWKSNPATQIKWGLKYIKGRYKTPCGAWSHMDRTGWY
ncbi:lytic transglycosylase domain-containing protein [Actinoallomurus purpureus]|uniref:aggregation-promoting factor C-terminal-like domain-containing protein n=1 Tax=Actinoallomurus purpureus TaxID=478114 RepID=UPI002092E56A|nr:transglycosylase SLT domain-containing protein [Actinoallomurus purpureus]MCO6006666.1 lytic transglycosylase domain-containing protein [Actinoallomurus purpureus]